MRVRTKICGVTSLDAVRAAVAHGADAIGFIFAEESPRRLTVEQARDLAAAVPAFVTRVAVFRHPTPEHVVRICAEFGPDVIQSEPTPALEDVLPSLSGIRFLPVLHDHPGLVDDVRASAGRWPHGVLLEAAGRGGRGEAPDWGRAADIARRIPLVLAGGLGPDNVEDAVRAVRPYGVDVSSGVEREPGIKDPDLIARFLDAARAVRMTNDLAAEAR